MGSYLSAPMLVFRLGVLPRTCETSCGDGPAGASHGSLGALLFLPPLPRRPAARRTVFFISSYFAVALVSCPALPLYPDTSLVTFHIQSPLAYLGAPGTRCARTGRGGGRGRGRGRGRGEKEAGGKRNNANMGAHYVGKSRAGGRLGGRATASFDGGLFEELYRWDSESAERKSTVCCQGALHRAPSD